MNGSSYERELRGILEADDKVLHRVLKSLTVLEKENYLKIKSKPFAVIRAAGSYGIDLVAVRGDISFLIEIKTSGEKTLHFSTIGGKLQEQALAMKTICERTRTLPIYAFRLKKFRGDAWRIFTLDMENLMGRLHIIHRRLPQLETSKRKNYIMRWPHGMQLSEFIAYCTRD
jgi:Holliday junction resolvase